ncbi:hypothetical protein SAMN05216349_13310 [Oribacterium sp. KHPX15]|uniref:anthrax toxin lethal factor-related metalloendopeptidase n=1 Tax=Oribacterium sp. KHPX15 TaxID=1855342 RepID=UPI00089AA3A3|nr:hypothetical protein [Oribacterium sp. KHPX15]SEA82799.1 hypothetical protein SAMN05216349_13310 [Oribacterium sp. KHPX15]
MIKKILPTALAAVGITLSGALTSFAAIPLSDFGSSVNPTQIQAVTNQYNMIPASIRQAYEASGNVIYFFDTNPLVDSVLGAYSGQEGQEAKIILTNQDYGGAEAITHEMGHYFDDICMADQNAKMKVVVYKGIKFLVTEEGDRFISDTDEFKRIFEYEVKSSPVSSYEKTDANEYFAGAFGLYCTDPDTLMAYAPYTYNYIDKLVKDFTELYPASAENIALTVTIPATIDEITGGATVSGLYINNGSSANASGQTSYQDPTTAEVQSARAIGNVTQVSGVSSNGTSYTGYTNANIETEEGAARTNETVENAVSAASQGEGTTTVVNADGSVTTTTVKSTPYGTLVSVVTTYQSSY